MVSVCAPDHRAPAVVRAGAAVVACSDVVAEAADSKASASAASRRSTFVICMNMSSRLTPPCWSENEPWAPPPDAWAVCPMLSRASSAIGVRHIGHLVCDLRQCAWKGLAQHGVKKEFSVRTSERQIGQSTGSPSLVVSARSSGAMAAWEEEEEDDDEDEEEEAGACTRSADVSAPCVMSARQICASVSSVDLARCAAS